MDGDDIRAGDAGGGEGGGGRAGLLRPLYLPACLPARLPYLLEQLHACLPDLPVWPACMDGNCLLPWMTLSYCPACPPAAAVEYEEAPALPPSSAQRVAVEVQMSSHSEDGEGSGDGGGVRTSELAPGFMPQVR